MASNGAESPEKTSVAGAPPRPAGPPPPPPPGIAVAGGSEVDLHQDIARSIGHQVEVMILDAKHQSETKVGREIQKIKQKMEAMAEKIRMTTERVAALEPGRHGLLKSDLQASITKLEEVWEGEVGTLKHELWQTIQAHNHNADLLKHHKDAIDQVQVRMTDLGPDPELEQVHAQLMAVDKVMQKELQKEQQMDQLMSRLTLVQQQLMGAWSGGSQGFLAAQAAAASGAALNPALASQACAAAVAAGKKQQRKAPKAAKGAKAASAASMASMANAASLRAEAPEFVPTWGGSDS
eukprot:TRINITY_DN110317_c0_g1_i1.p1 TRINITY_DN110317_c0_g1~~TRINITY_DN110317_c0_g1_i1.p1  ORF type:complete len:294 (-),score=83.21 TRINITY_DN110317_c0_g1_i1:125-1006(-)